MVTWSLENAIETADSMKSRGYGLPGRSAFSIYKFENRDGIALVIIALCSAFIIVGKVMGYIDWSYYPMMTGSAFSVVSVLVYFVYAGLCLLPLIINIKEDRKWKRLKSEI